MSVTQIDVPPVSFKDKGGDGRRRHQLQSEMTCPLRPALRRLGKLVVGASGRHGNCGGDR
jgi:hypothetical protein